ncbi:MAG: HAMP domain-containing histidine kinase [Hyphomicrobiales bacterium]|nr:MAG: HAMP domain-containing histidine kinase [Hyphomicrobiales bacterium]
MAVRLPIVLMPVASVVFAAGVAVLAGWIVLASDRMVDRIDAAQAQLDALREVDGAMSRYGRQAVDQLLFGYDRSGALQTARNDMDRVLANLTRATRAEMHTLSGPAELQAELPEIEQVRRMVDTYRAIDTAAIRAFRLADNGDAAGARDVMSREVDFRLTNEMQPLISGNIADEAREVSDKLAALAQWRQDAVIASAAAALLLLVGLIALAVWLQRRTRQLLATAEGEAEAALANERAEADRAHERIRALSDARGKLLADVGHQLRTPLTVLRGEADVALRGEADSGALVESMTRIRGQAAELGHLLEDFIEAARQAAEPRMLSRVPVQIDDIVASAADEAAVLVDSREIALKLDLASAGEVEADFRALKQAVMIGLDNAIKHSPPGGTIDVSTSVQEGRVTIRVGDQGPGVPDADKPHVFERFYRGSQEDELLNPGFGIGLSIAKDIVERHEGTVSLDNRPQGGAVFAITLPLIARQS